VASIHEHNTQTTYEYLPKADAAIFILSVDPPLTQAELSFLADIKKTAAKIFFIQNKIDTVSRADWEESLTFSKRAIEERAGFKDITIYPLSAKEALEGKLEDDQQKIDLSGLRDFERVLELFLIKEKGQILRRSLNEKIISLINQEFLLAEIEKKAFSFSTEELNNKIKTFQIFINDINQEWIDSSRLFKAEIINLEKEILAEDLEKLKREKTAGLLTEILRFAAGQQKVSNQKFAKLIEEFISINIKTIFNIWRIKEEKILKKEIVVISERFIRRLDIITEKIFSSSAELFGLSRREIKISETLAPKIEFRFQIKDEDTMLSIIIDSFKKILPKAISHKLILKEAQDNIVQLIDRHCGKSRYDFSRRLDKLVQEYHLSMEITIKSIQSEVLKALEAGIKSKQETADKIIYQENQLNQRLSILKILQASTQQIKTLINK